MSSMFSTTGQNPPVVLKMDEVNLKRVYIKKSHNFLENYFLSAGSTEVDITAIKLMFKMVKKEIYFLDMWLGVNSNLQIRLQAKYEAEYEYNFHI